MAQYHTPDPEDLIECPYDAVHMVRAKRFQYHLMKCRKNYRGREYGTCPYNATHEMPLPELRYHMTHCSHQAMLEPDVLFKESKSNNDGSYFKGNTSVPDYNNTDWKDPEPTENWDSEPAGNGMVQRVDPTVFTGKTHEATILTKSKKKEIYDNLRRQGIQIDSPKSATKDGNGGKNSGSVDGLRGLRLPHEQPQVLQRAAKLSGQGEGSALTNGVVLGTSTSPAPHLSMAGVGRGREGNAGPSAAAEVGRSQKENATLMLALMKGRGIGRGIAVPPTAPGPGFSFGEVQPASQATSHQKPAGRGITSLHNGGAATVPESMP